MPILVTGATGFIGRRLATRLVSDGRSPVLLLRESYGGGQALPAALYALRADVDVVYADLRNAPQTRRAVARSGASTVIHLAAAGATDPFLPVETALRHNLNGSLNLIRACFETPGGVRRLVIARTPGETTAENVYAATKAAAWSLAQMYARTRGWPITGAMIFQAYGPGQPDTAVLPAAARAALAGEDFPMTNGATARDWVFVDDVAAGLAAAAGADLPPGTTIDLGTGRATPVVDVVARLFGLVGGDGRPRPGLLPDRPGETAGPVADAARTQALIGWSAETSLDAGVRQLLAAATGTS